MYATEQDIISRYGQQELLVCFDRDQLGVADAAAVSGALADAAAEIDGYLAGRYPLPLGVEAARVLVGYCVDIALYKGSVGMAQTEGKRQRYEDAVKFLRLVGEGKIRLGVPEAAAPTHDQVHAAAAPAVFSRDSLRDY